MLERKFWFPGINLKKKIQRLGEGIDHQRDPTHIHTVFDFLSGFSVSSWPGWSRSGPPVSVIGLSSATHSQQADSIAQMAICLQALVYKMTKRSLGETKKSWHRTDAWLGIFEPWTLVEGKERTRLLPPPLKVLCTLFLCLERQPFFTRPGYLLPVMQVSDEMPSLTRLLPWTPQSR